MGTQLTIVNNNNLSLEERQEIDAHIDQVISRHKNNRYEINKLVFESVSALTASENYSNELHSQGTVKKFFGDLTGKNRELQRNIDNSLARSQYASQQTLQKLAEQNLMSFELITAVNNKLNASLVAVENEINNIYGILVTFFKQSKSDIIQLENRVERLERNVNLLNWQNSIEYQMFNGVEYAELDDISKIVCMVRDFYDITKGQWTTSDLLLLKTAMATIDISPKAVGNYFDFVKSVCYNKTLSNKLFGNKLIVRQPNPEYLTMLSGINKLDLLGSKEHYVVDTVLEQVGQASDEKTISENLTKSYIAQEASVNIQVDIPFFDMMLETLYCLSQGENENLFADSPETISHNEYLKRKFSKELQTAEEFYLQGRHESAFEIFFDLAEKSCSRAMYFVGEYYRFGYGQVVKIDKEKGFEWHKRGCELGEILCELQLSFMYERGSKERISIQEKLSGHLKKLSDEGDVFAQFEYADICHEHNEKIALLEEASAKGHWRAMYKLGQEYYGKDRTDEEYSIALQYFYKAAHKGCADAWGYIGLMYDWGYGVKENTSLANEFWRGAAELGSVFSMRNIADRYYDGYGIEKDHAEAKKWYIKAAELGDDDAKIKLKEKFGL